MRRIHTDLYKLADQLRRASEGIAGEPGWPGFAPTQAETAAAANASPAPPSAPPVVPIAPARERKSTVPPTVKALAQVTFTPVPGSVTCDMQASSPARRRNATCVEVSEEATDRYHRMVMERMSGSVWHAGSCATANSYYFDHHGDTPYLRPTSSRAAAKAARTFPLGDYRFDSLVPGSEPAKPERVAA